MTSTATPRHLPMFPLGNPLLPGEACPLRIFEPRYLAMMSDIAGGSPPEFGVVLIARGSEVGGGDERHAVGCLAEVVDQADIAEGQLAVVVLGTHRIRIAEWITDDPYPTAAVEPIDPNPEVSTPADGAVEHITELEHKLQHVYALASELGADVATVDRGLPDDVAAATWRIGSLLPIGPHDRQQLLETGDLQDRLHVLDRLAEEAVDELTMRLATGG